jgi:hypothetical protein
MILVCSYSTDILKSVMPHVQHLPSQLLQYSTAKTTPETIANDLNRKTARATTVIYVLQRPLYSLSSTKGTCQLQAQHHHACHPEEQNVVSRLQD